jgi:hypothetical protein
MRPLRPIFRPNSGHPQALGEHVVTPHSLPGWERRRPRRISASRAAPTAKGGIAKGRIFLGCLAQTEGIVVMFQFFAGSLVQKGNFNSVALLVELLKSLENRRKFGKLQTQFC